MSSHAAPKTRTTSLGELVAAAFDEARRLTQSPAKASRLALRAVNDLLARRRRFDLISRLRTT